MYSKYVPLRSNEEGYAPTRYHWKTAAVVHGLILSIYTGVFFGVSLQTDRFCTKKLSNWSPALEAVSYETIYFNGEFGTVNKYIGTPTPQVDKEWEHIGVNAPGIRLFESDFEAMGKSLEERDWYRIDEEFGGGYLGMTEVFHLLHCLDAIRKFTNPDHYPELYSKRNEYQTRIHTDHCVDIIRQRLMCTGDVGPVPFYKSPPNKLPVPDFSTRHECRNFEDLLEWSHTNDRALYWDEIGDLNLTHVRPDS